MPFLHSFILFLPLFWPTAFTANADNHVKDISKSSDIQLLDSHSLATMTPMERNEPVNVRACVMDFQCLHNAITDIAKLAVLGMIVFHGIRSSPAHHDCSRAPDQGTWMVDVGDQAVYVVLQFEGRNYDSTAQKEIWESALKEYLDSLRQASVPQVCDQQCVSLHHEGAYHVRMSFGRNRELVRDTNCQFSTDGCMSGENNAIISD